MFFAKIRRHAKSLALRLTLWYTGIAAVSLILVLCIAYLVLRSNLDHRLDEELVSEVGEYSALLNSQGLKVLTEVIGREAMSEGTDKLFYQVLDNQGRRLSASDMTAWKHVPVDRDLLQEALAGKTLLTTLSSTKDRPETRILYARLRPGMVLQVGKSLESVRELLENFREIFGIAVTIIVVCSVIVGWFMATGALSGVANVTQTAASIARGDLNSRVELSGRDDEIDELAKTFNEMIGRIQSLIHRMREISDDIAHDLRTPIMRMRGAAEAALTDVNYDERKLEITAGSMVEECDNLLGLINNMLELSETQAGVSELSEDEFDVSLLLRDVCELFQPAAEDKGVTLRFNSDGPLVIHGDRKKIRRALGHIIDNAVKYTQSGDSVTAECTRNGRCIFATITDTGIGISEEDLPHIFARFYRADRSRTQTGNGLGLSLAMAIVNAHGGDIKVKSELGAGSRFHVTLPIASSSSG